MVEQWIRKVRKIWRYIRQKKIPVYAAYSGYFIMLSVFPMLVLLLGLLRYTGLSADSLIDFLRGLIPQALLTPAKRLILSTYRNTTGRVLSISALAALWSSSRGIHGLMTGLNTICGVKESRNWLHTRLVSMFYTVLCLAVLSPRTVLAKTEMSLSFTSIRYSSPLQSVSSKNDTSRHSSRGLFFAYFRNR